MLIIRFVRAGRKKQAFFQLVVAEKKNAVQKKFHESLGYYNPHSNGGAGELVIKEDRIKHFISNGAQISQTAARILAKNGIKEAGKFIKERVSKPKKTPAPTEEKPKTEDQSQETSSTENISSDKEAKDQTKEPTE